MTKIFVIIIRSLIVLAIVVPFPVLPGCGAVGPPIAPEDIGIEAKVREQERQSRQSKGESPEDQDPSDTEDTVELPTFYPSVPDDQKKPIAQICSG